MKTRNTHKYPEQLQDLLTYSKYIKKLMAAGDQWQYYDHHFRLDREHSLYSWSQIRIDLQLDAARNRPKTGSPDSNNMTQTPNVPSGYCYRFNSKSTTCRKGRTCTYRHNCPRCTSFHSVYLNCDPSRQRTIALSTILKHQLRHQLHRSFRMSTLCFVNPEWYKVKDCTPIRIKALSRMLKNYHNKHYVIEGFKSGFKHHFRRKQTHNFR